MVQTLKIKKQNGEPHNLVINKASHMFDELGPAKDSGNANNGSDFGENGKQNSEEQDGSDFQKEKQNGEPHNLAINKASDLFNGLEPDEDSEFENNTMNGMFDIRYETEEESKWNPTANDLRMVPPGVKIPT